MRGCACRGDSAGFVHLECLTELAKSKEASRDRQTANDGWLECGNCKQTFQGTLRVEMDRRFWRRHRSSQDLELRYNSTRALAISLGSNGEVDATNQLLDEASTCVGNNMTLLLDLKLFRAHMLSTNGQKLEALGLLQAMLPEAKLCTATPHLYEVTLQKIADVFLALDRNQEAQKAAAELVAITKAKFGLENFRTLVAVRTYAIACAKLGRVEEAKTTFKDVLNTQSRVFGRDHPYTQHTRECMRIFAPSLTD